MGADCTALAVLSESVRKVHSALDRFATAVVGRFW